MSSFEWIKPLKTEPKPKKKQQKVASIANKIISEFVASALKYAAVPETKIVPEHYKTLGSAARAIGRVVKRRELHNSIRVFATEKQVNLVAI